MRYALTLIALLCVTLVAVPAPVCQTGVCHTPYAAAPVVAAAVVVPAYGAGYVGAASADDETKDLLRRIADGQERILQALERLGGGTVGIQGGPDENAVAVAQKAIQTKCASCHTGASAARGFELANDEGKLVQLNGLSRRTALDHIEARGGKVLMPPPNKPQLTPAEKAAIRAAFADKPAPIPAGK